MKKTAGRKPILEGAVRKTKSVALTPLVIEVIDEVASREGKSFSCVVDNLVRDTFAKGMEVRV